MPGWGLTSAAELSENFGPPAQSLAHIPAHASEIRPGKGRETPGSSTGVTTSGVEMPQVALELVGDIGCSWVTLSGRFQPRRSSVFLGLGERGRGGDASPGLGPVSGFGGTHTDE